MNRHLILLLMKNYVRSHRHFPPLVFFLFGLAMLYSYRPNPVTDSYAMSAILVYVVCAWIGYGIISSTEETHGHIIAIHSGNVRTYLLGKTLMIFLCGFSVALFALLFPVATNMFDERLSVHQWLLAFIVHMELSLLGMLIPLYFHRPFFHNGSFSVASVMAILIVSLVKDGIAGKFGGGLELLWWLLPPVSQPVNLLAKPNSLSAAHSLVALIYPLVYFFALYFAYFWLWKRKR